MLTSFLFKLYLDTMPVSYTHLVNIKTTPINIIARDIENQIFDFSIILNICHYPLFTLNCQLDFNIPMLTAHFINVFVTTIAVNILTAIPIINVTANPFTQMCIRDSLQSIQLLY